MVVVDISRRVLVAALAASALYHPPDAWPHARPPRHGERQRSPSLDQVLRHPPPYTGTRDYTHTSNIYNTNIYTDTLILLDHYVTYSICFKITNEKQRTYCRRETLF